MLAFKSFKERLGCARPKELGEASPSQSAALKMNPRLIDEAGKPWQGSALFRPCPDPCREWGGFGLLTRD
jgi:hypothetical protein